VIECAEPELEHPLRLILEAADLLDGRTGQATLRLGEVDDVVVEGVLVAPVGDEVSCCSHQAPMAVRAADGGSKAKRGRPSSIPSNIIGISRRSVNDASVAGVSGLSRQGSCRPGHQAQIDMFPRWLNKPRANSTPGGSCLLGPAFEFNENGYSARPETLEAVFRGLPAWKPGRVVQYTWKVVGFGAR
jgi:hypothetical protein